MRMVALSLVVLTCCARASFGLSINEIRIDQPSTDADEYFELSGSPGQDLDTLTYLVIGDGTTTFSGTIEAVVSLAGQFIPDNGYFLATEATFGSSGTPFEDAMPDFTTVLNFENNDNVTHLLVDGFFGSNGEDLDPDDDGLLDTTPWTSVVDSVCLVRHPVVMSGTDGIEQYYCSSLGGSDVGPDGTNTPGHIYRIPDTDGPFQIGFFPGTGDPGFQDTPGEDNEGSSTGNCDFDDDGLCDCDDVNALVVEISGGGNLDFDLNGDGMLDTDDLEEWLTTAGEMNLASGNAYLLGDANLDGEVNGRDFLIWNEHKFTNSAAWCLGDFNADGTIDGIDFTIWNDHKFTSANDDFSTVPEPVSLLLAAFLSACWWRDRLWLGIG